MNRREMSLFSRTALSDGLIAIPRKAPFRVGQGARYSGVEWTIGADNGDGTFDLFNYPVAITNAREEKMEHIAGSPEPFSRGV